MARDDIGQTPGEGPPRRETAARGGTARREAVARPVTARGFRDVLFEETLERDGITTAMLAHMGSWGYRRVETPTLERFDVLSAGAGETMEREAFRLVDLDGGLLALRPEMTVPIARLVASRLDPSLAPHRVSYREPVFREHASLRGQTRQFTQVGMELVGTSGARADAEVVAVCVGCLRASGLREFGVSIGDAGLLRAVLVSAGGDEGWIARVMEALHRRNLVELDALAVADGVESAYAGLLRRLPRVRGGAVALDAAAELLEPVGMEDRLRPLRRMAGLLSAAGVREEVTFDLGLVRSFDYYTGIVLEAHAPGLGVAVGGGGRYDHLLGSFGESMPAAGFALGLERIQVALDRQDVRVPVDGNDLVVGGTDEAAVFAEAAERRREGASVRISAADTRAALEAEADAYGARAIWIEGTQDG